jgi:adenosine deaminase
MTDERPDVLRTFVASLPKAELHLHLEGTLEPEMMFELAERNGVALPYRSVDALRAAYDFTNLQSFLDLYYAGAGVLRTEQDFYDLTRAYLERAHADGVVHVEPFFDPQTHLTRGIEFSTVIDGIVAALRDGERDLGIKWRLIMCFLRDLPAADAMRVLELADGHREVITGVGLDSAEAGNPPSKFAEVFTLAAERGYRRVAHAGEEGPASYITEALDLLGAERIDHGDACLRDPDLVDRLRCEQVPLTVCPLSNVKLHVVHSIAEHPLARLMGAGLLVTVNSDDPAYFGGYIADNFRAVAGALNLSEDDLIALARNSFEASFLPDDEKRARAGAVDAYAQSRGVARHG